MSCPTAPLVDVVIPVHTPDRPTDRAVGSVAAAGLPVTDRGGVRITLVCHNIDPARIAEVLSPAHRELVHLVGHADGSRSPAGPRNLGLERSTARYVSFVDCDDTLDPGALSAWTAIAERHGSAAVLPRLVTDTGVVVRTPVPRPRRRSRLDPVRDRLAYRTHAFGLLRRDALLAQGLRFHGQYATGEDQELAVRTWFGGGRVDLAPPTARYVLHGDAVDRISAQARPVGQDLAAFTDLLSGSWFAGLEPARRTAIAVKIVRVQLFGAVSGRAGAGQWSAQDAASCRTLAERVASAAPDALAVLPRADRDLLDLVVQQQAPAAEVLAASSRRRRFGRPATLVPRDPRRLLHREAPLRFMAASLLV